MNKHEEYQEALDFYWKVYEEHHLGMLARHYIDILKELIVQQSILEEYNVTPEILREVLLTCQMFRNQPTLSECIKEWEDRGWTYSKSKPFNWFIVEKNYKKIIFDGYEVNYSCAKEFDIDLELNDLITKTLKALEVEND